MVSEQSRFLGVIFYHLGGSSNGFVPNGYFGVDVFFVISGYIIGSILFEELHSTNKINLISFFVRRSRRLLPALAFVLSFSLILGWQLFFPYEFTEFARQLICSIFFVANFCFHTSSVEYGATSSDFLPLLHLWSLSIEEQFYIIFPIALLCLYKFKHEKFLPYILAFFFSLSLGYVVFQSYLTPKDIFFSLTLELGNFYLGLQLHIITL